MIGQAFSWFVKIALVLILSLMLGLLTGRIALNGSESLPGEIYWLSPIQPGDVITYGDVLAFLPPANPFFPPDRKFLKIVRGVPGDLVERFDRDDGQHVFLINGEVVGIAKDRPRIGFETLTPGPIGLIPQNHYFVWTPHVDSYDSRYADIGWIDRSRVIARAYKLL